MAQKAQRERTTTSTTSSAQNTNEPAATPKPSFISRIPSFLMASPPTAAATTAAGAKPKSPWRRLLFGMLIFIVAMQVFEYVLFFIGAKLKLNLSAPLGKSVPIIGSLSWFTFIYLLFMLALYIGLLRFNVIPNGKTMRAQRTAAQQQATPAPTTHAARKRAARHAVTTTATTVSTARRTATTARVKGGQVASTTTNATGIGDDVYERVKAAQRTRRRRDAKR
ncbi:MAG TPA: hypothetical protein VKQ30_11070 [Ktedonobacterales bacterium]|nr:hypothetical protein [Ktedonobacterales bacterium]